MTNKLNAHGVMTRQATMSNVERMLAAAPEPALWAMEQVRRRLAAHEAELKRTLPSPRRTELDALVAEDIEELCQGFVRLERAVERAEPT
jgi:hypothetical protein